MAGSRRSAWEGFIPEKSLIMARRSSAAATAVAPVEHVDLMFVGEQCTDAGAQLLDKMIEAMGCQRGDVLVSTELDRSKLLELLNQIRPKIVVALGEAAARALPEAECLHPAGVKCIPTYHPSHLLAHPEAKREAWEHLKTVARELGITIPARRG